MTEHNAQQGTAATVAAEIKRLRTAANMTQKRLGDLIGVTGARISQLEDATTAMPPDDVLVKLAGVLGDDILRAARWGPFGQDWSFRDAAMAALWRVRIDVLRNQHVLKSSPQARERGLRLAEELEAVACRAAEASSHVRNAQLDSFRRVVSDIPDGALMITAVEAMGMVMDAPLHVLTPDDRWRARSEVAQMFREARPRLEFDEARKALESGPRLFWWDELPNAGGTLGQLHALCSGDPSVLLLKGHEPSGWMGWPMMAGMWQVRPVELRNDEGGKKAADAVARLGGNLAGSERLWIPPVQRVPMAEAALHRINRAQRLHASDQPSLGWLGDTDEEVRHQILTARALGSNWVRQHAKRLAAVYRGFPKAADGDPESDLPAKAQALGNISTLHQTAKKLLKREEAESGKWDREENELLREWAGLRDAWENAAKQLT